MKNNVLPLVLASTLLGASGCALTPYYYEGEEYVVEEEIYWEPDGGYVTEIRYDVDFERIAGLPNDMPNDVDVSLDLPYDGTVSGQNRWVAGCTHSGDDSGMNPYGNESIRCQDPDGGTQTLRIKNRGGIEVVAKLRFDIYEDGYVVHSFSADYDLKPGEGIAIPVNI